MTIITILGISLGLSMDALAVSITNGCIIKDLKVRQAFRIACSFGIFQAIMPLIGWAAGLTFSSYIENFDHWVAFGLLIFIGGKMILESRKLDNSCDDKSCLDVPTLLLLSIATSIDALAVGLSFALLNVPILKPILIIGGVTFVVCIGGVFLGNRIGHLAEGKLELVGGSVLILIGVKILIEHIG
ncbi:MAG TPA: manganese efflux pump MntP family protein [Spirochaetales bacterium]|nr:manganese efflux pump MntP family protein [Spirochaetales bacterium]